jgi:CspA family cold shock protein
MKQGTVKFYNATKGYGFIKTKENNEEIFVHSSGVTEPIHDNDKVEFEVIEGKKGMNAVKVKKIA